MVPVTARSGPCAAQLLADRLNRPISRGRMWHWMNVGVLGKKYPYQRIVLESVTLNGRRYTSVEAVQRFLAAAVHDGQHGIRHESEP